MLLVSGRKQVAFFDFPRLEERGLHGSLPGGTDERERLAELGAQKRTLNQSSQGIPNLPQQTHSPLGRSASSCVRRTNRPNYRPAIPAIPEEYFRSVTRLFRAQSTAQPGNFTPSGRGTGFCHDLPHSRPVGAKSSGIEEFGPFPWAVLTCSLGNSDQNGSSAGSRTSVTSAPMPAWDRVCSQRCFSC